ncbi:MAG: CopD family protein [Gemmatimonadota bacterium]|nr:CopD family protein [Gemmatimonadota bacterium]
MIQLWFSEQPEIALTGITLTNSSGVAMSLGVVTAVPDTALSVIVSISASLPAGDYTVAWRTMATDGHPSHGTFVFSVATGVASGVATGASAGTTVGVAPGAQAAGRRVSATVGALHSNMADSMQNGMAVESPIYVAVRWISFMALILIIGVVAFRWLVLPRTDSGATHGALSDAVLPRLATLGFAASVVLVAATVWRLYAEHAVMGPGMDVSMFDMVRRTAWGTAWLVQMSAAIVACAGFALIRAQSPGTTRLRPQAKSEERTREPMRSGWIVATIAALVLGVTPALSGHAAAAPHLRWLALTADSLHVLAAGGWLGSLFAMAAVGVPVALVISTDRKLHAAPLVAELVNAFSPTALAFAAAVVATGIISAWLRLESVSALWRSTYGKVLLVKLALVVLVLAGGAFNWLRIRGALSDAVPGDEATKRFRQSGMLELVAGALVIVVTAVLVATPTPI